MQLPKNCGLGILVATALLSLGAGPNEINHTCIVNGVCPNTGDTTAGYPEVIGLPGSFVLVSNLTPPPGFDAISITANGVTLDLGGYVIDGGTTVPGIGDGVVVAAGVVGLVVRNGTVLQMPDDGIDSASTSGMVRIEGINAIGNNSVGIEAGSVVIAECVAEGNASDGIVSALNAVVTNSAATSNGGNGFLLGANSSVSNSTANNNAGVGFNLAPQSRFLNNTSLANAFLDSCGGGLCTERKRFYLTQQSYDGANANTVCSVGFHLASVWEIVDTSAFAYDYLRAEAFTNYPGGQQGGAPAQYGGWAWTGENGVSFDCRGWTSAVATDVGTVVTLNGAVRNDRGVKRLSPWEGSTVGCSIPQRVWCVEDPPL